MSDSREYDVSLIKSEFPVFSKNIYGKQLVYLDNAASSQKPNIVIDKMANAYRYEYANVHRGLHYLSNKATENYEDARKTVAEFINSNHVNEIVFTKNATEALNLVAHSYGGEMLTEGDEIILTIMEHHSNIVPWHFLREKNKIKIKWLSVNDDGDIDLDEFRSLITDKTKLISLTHMSNVLGTVLPIKEMVAIAHDKNIPVVVDGTQAIVHHKVDVQDLDVDFYVFTGHKLYGPSGIGVLYGKSDYLEKMVPYQGGGEMIEEVYTDRVVYGKPPQRFEAGTPAIIQSLGLKVAIDYINTIGQEKILQHENLLKDYAENKLKDIDGLKIIGNSKTKGAIFSFILEGIHPHDVSTIIDRSGVAIRAGMHCAEPLLARYNVQSTCRASFAMYNTTEDVDILCNSLLECKNFFR
ncbi:cysteine desulfurase [Hyphomicrobiales bacterium]|jgi:cysteine desulfurase/selenocysteine lyase|nr:cysteine desulfurase [Hyphomicrobiales bacterium]MDC3272530.1 cysteine desulfurase [Hyphomicrobiales bacterium]|tara:strand:+ start:969 stop:2201 length:1233 start_codon:yes stop_codon:yes gene_type:complete